MKARKRPNGGNVSLSDELERIKRGIAAYAHEQAALTRLLRKRGFFTEKEFDGWLRGREWKRPCFVARGMTGDAFILGIGINGGNLWAEWLEILQYMVVLGVVETSTVDGLVNYRLRSNDGLEPGGYYGDQK